MIVGLCVERSLEMVIGLLGILKAGGAYLPLDPSYPADRLCYMLSDARAPVLVTQARFVAELPAHDGHIVRIDADWAGIAAQPQSVARDDGQALEGAFITAACRCVPPDNRPTPEELARCAPFLDRELEVLGEVRVVLALGAIAWEAVLAHVARKQGAPIRPKPRFAHGAELALPGGRTLLGSYHVSRQNTQTGRLTPEMFDAVLARAGELRGER